jgi:hypothetical protein
MAEMPPHRLRITKRTVDAAQATEARYTVWDSDLTV